MIPQNSIKLSFGVIVLNGEPFIKYNLENLYPHAHEILVVEGAVEKFCHAATPDGHSLDDTVGIIKSFPDPDNKIKLIQRDGFWPEKDEMSNAYMEVCTGDYIWQVDVDEFYKPDDIEAVREMLINDPEISRVDFRSVGFWRSFKARVCGASFIFGADQFIRLFKFKPGYRYVTHRPPTLADVNGAQFIHNKIITAIEMENHGIVQYHYSYVFPEYVAGKAHYYSQMGWGGGHQDGMSWYNQNWVKISNPLRVHIIEFPPSWIVPFAGDHPEVIKRLQRDISYVEDLEITKFLEKNYIKYNKIGEVISQQIIKPRTNKISHVKAFIVCLTMLLFPFSIREFKANVSILTASIRLLVK